MAVHDIIALAPHQQIPYFGTVPTVITIIVQHSADTAPLQYRLHKVT